MKTALVGFHLSRRVAFIHAVLLLIAFLLIVSTPASAQLNGAYDIPGTYATISEAIDAINADGVSGWVIFNVAAGHRETAVNLMLTTTEPNAKNFVVFRKSGTGPNPLIMAGVGTGNYDGIISFVATDYVTFDGIDLMENPANSGPTALLEWGYGIFSTGSREASQHIVIKNCAITMRAATPTILGGIYANNSRTVDGRLVNPSAYSEGCISYCELYGNTITDCYQGIYFQGWNGMENGRFNTIGVPYGNIITGFGGADARAYGIYTIFEEMLRIENNIISGGVGSTGDVYGIYTGPSGDIVTDVINNTITLATSATSATTCGILIEAESGNEPNSMIKVRNNRIEGPYSTTLLSGDVTGICTNTVAGIINIQDNVIRNITINSLQTSTSALYGIVNSRNPVSTLDISNNRIENLSLNGIGKIIGISNRTTRATTPVSIHGNTISNLTNLGPFGYIYGIMQSQCSSKTFGNTVRLLRFPHASSADWSYIYGYFGNSSSKSEAVYDNVFSDFSISGDIPIFSNRICGIYHLNGDTASTSVFYGNTIKGYSFSNTSAGSGEIHGFYVEMGGKRSIYANDISDFSSGGKNGICDGIYINGGHINNVYNNLISDLRSPESSNSLAISGLYVRGGRTNNLDYNTVYLDARSTSDAGFGTTAVYIGDSPMFGTQYHATLRNNILVNQSTAGSGTGGVTVVYRRAQALPDTSALLSDNNCLYAGIPTGDSSRLLYYDGTTKCTDIATYKALMAPREQASFSELPPFVNVATSPYDLQLNTMVPTRCESGARNIHTPVITTDFTGVIRQGNTGYSGTSTTNPDVGAYEFDGVSFIPMTYTSSTTSGIMGKVAPGTGNVMIIGIQIVTTNSYNPLRVTQFNVNTNGTDTKADIANARIYYTGNSPTFTNISQFGPDVPSPGGSFAIRGMQQLSEGVNHFWLVYDVAASAISGHHLDAECTQFTIEGDTLTPFISAPPGYLLVTFPLCGTYSIPGVEPTGFPTISAAITALNNIGVRCPVIFNVAAGYVESAVNLVLTDTTATSMNYVVFQKAGEGVNPLIISTKGDGEFDGIIEFQGSSFVTFDMVDLQENPTNSNPKHQLEWGYGIFTANGARASHNITIKNCTVTLKPDAEAVQSGILINNNIAANGLEVLPTTMTGLISDCQIYGNSVMNCTTGISLRGCSMPFPYDPPGRNNSVGVPAGNNIVCGLHTAYGIYSDHQDELRVENNTVSFEAVHIGAACGIYVESSANTTATIQNNTINLSTNNGGDHVIGIDVEGFRGKRSGNIEILENTINGLSSNETLDLIFHGIYANVCSDSLRIRSNIVQSIRNSWATVKSGLFYGILNCDSSHSIDIADNMVRNVSLAGTATAIGIADESENPTGTSNISNNTIKNITLSGASGRIVGIAQRTALIHTAENMVHGLQISTRSGNEIRIITGVATDTISVASADTIFGYWNEMGSGSMDLHDNTFDDFLIAGSTSSQMSIIAGMYMMSINGYATRRIYSNTAKSLLFDNTNVGSATIYGLYTGSIGTVEISKNSMFDFSAGGIAGQSHGIYVNDSRVSGPVTNNVYNNYVSDLRAPFSESFSAVNGLSFNGSRSTTRNNGFYNTVYLHARSSYSTGFGVNSILAYAIPTTTLRNNIFVNLSIPGTNADAIAAAYRRIGAQITTCDLESDYNCLYVGDTTGNPRRVLFSDASQSCTDIASYKALMAPREQHSFSELPPFANTTMPPYNLRMRTDTPTRCESGARPVLSPPITDDFYGAPRNPLTPDVGAEEFFGIVMSVPPVADPDFTLFPNFPNPCTASTTLSFTLRRAGYTSVHVYDITGRLVKTLDAGRLGAELNHVTLTTAGLAPGRYTYRIQSGASTRSGSLTVAR